MRWYSLRAVSVAVIMIAIGFFSPVSTLIISSCLASNSQGMEAHTSEVDLRMRLDLDEMVAYDSMRPLMSTEQRVEYLSLHGSSARMTWMEKFWKQLDPTITTAENERRLEHFERLKLARELFPVESYPGWDTRGDMFIRYGMPATRQRIWATVSQSKLSMPGERWTYGAPDTTFNFIDNDLSGTYRFVVGGTDRDAWTVLREDGLYEAPGDDDVASMIRSTLSDNVDISFETTEAGDLLKEMVELISGRYGIKDYWPSGDENSFFLFPDLDLNMVSFFDILCFSGGDGKIRTEVNLEIPVTELALKQEDSLLKSEVEMRIIVFDMEMKEVASSEEKFTLVSSAGAQSSAAYSLLGQTVMTLDPAPYRIWIEVIDLVGNGRSILKTRKWAHSLEGGLAISDIQFAKKVAESDRPSRYMKNNLVVIPHPLHLYRKPFPVTVYFEVYGLNTDDEDHTFYTVKYEIIPVRDDSPGSVINERPKSITSGFDTGGFGSTQPTRMLIATGELEEGPYILAVTVMDRRTREEVTKESRFSIIE
ncbi:MAG: GWxTD domain-containing protein [Bacteroidales bacterium]|nr:GWxTD domain-containing protein [Candidatus Latescibacterota bacterium]